MGPPPIFAAMLRALTIALALLAAVGPAQAQFWMPFGGDSEQRPARPAPRPQPQVKTSPKTSPATAEPSSPPAQDQPAPYDKDLQRLSEILGALHFLRGICGSNEGSKWRDEAQTLIDAEAPSGARHDQMIASFNRGYRGFQQSYRTCTPAADTVIRRYLEEGAKLARDITARYAN
jgi:uncharacterized protein (TIGR02301 family)